MRGKILKGIGGFYTVGLDGGGTLVCKARGVFRKDGTTPLPGDEVEAEEAKNGGEGSIRSIYERRNQMIRPAVANIDQLVIVMSLSTPKPDYLLADKLLIYAESIEGITPIIVFNKNDQVDDAVYEQACSDYQNTGYKLICVSAHTGSGVDALERELCGKVSCFAGQSAVGKTSLLNSLIPGLDMPVGDLARKTDRGRHTTRHAELWQLNNGGAVFDTPGFSLLDVAQLSPESLCEYYPEMRGAAKQCRFAGCLHISEPECAVKRRLEDGKISNARYQRYAVLIDELKEMRKRMYD